MPYILSGLATFLIVFTTLFIVTIYNVKKRRNIVEQLHHMGDLKPQMDKVYDYDFTLDGVTYKLKIIRIGNYNELSINSKAHWQLKPSKKIKMIPTDGFDTLEGPKILIVYPHPFKMVKYVNENEIVFIKPNELCFDFYIYSEKQLKDIKLP